MRRRSGGSFIQPLIQLLARWRDRLSNYVFTRDDGGLTFAFMLVVPIGFLLLMAYLAFTEQLRGTAERQRNTDLGCLARNIYHEARGEPVDGQFAVAEVTLNRVESTLFPDTVCDVVHEKRWDRKRGRNVGAFSWTELDQVSKPGGAAWDQALSAARSVYDGERNSLVHGALFYHAVSIEPRWARSKKQVARIGRHIFYE